MLVVGDIHGNYSKAKCFLNYKPEEQHCFVGDYTDSFKATNDEIIQTMKMIFESDAITLSGNHDNQYFTNSNYKMKCTGYRDEAYGFVHIMEMYKDKILGSCISDGFIITHGGITKSLTKTLGIDNIEDMNEYINFEFNQFKNSVVKQDVLSNIFNIGSCRGGSNQYSGIFWADYRYENFDKSFNQIFGHSHTSEPKMIYQGKSDRRVLHVCVDCPQYFCFNTKTKQIEDFFPEEFKKTRHMMEVIF